ncbi:glycoside hydrolase family 88/105 protein [Echinicola pacifica]|nr:glycoside hydrolase family 88 protein [Echinicola pacifica]
MNHSYSSNKWLGHFYGHHHLLRRLPKAKLWISFALISMLISTHGQAQDLPGRVPNYQIPYEYPQRDQIIALLHRVRGYYETSSEQKIIDFKTGKEITNLSSPQENARLTEGLSTEWSYTHGVVLSAFDYIDTELGDPVFMANNRKYYDWIVEVLPYFQQHAEQYGPQSGALRELTNTHALDHCGSIGAAMIKTYLKVKNEDYLPLINYIADYISNKEVRLPDGTLARHRPQYLSIWADDIYMAVPFLANMGKLTGNSKYYDDAVKQIIQMAERLYVPSKGLFDHGWSVTSGDYDPRFYWARANGWTLMAMAELLSILPESYQGRDQVMHLYRSMIQNLTSLQDGTGFWHNMLDKNDTFLETSATAMFTFAIAKGINEGWINHVYGPVAMTGWNAVATRVRPDGAVEGTVEATTFAHDNTYYFNRGSSAQATHGYGPVLYAGIEMIKLLENDKLQVDKAKSESINSTFHYKLKSEWPEDK